MISRPTSDEKVIIIGNSPTVLEEENGDFIDSHDIVIRINHCPVEGYEKFIGKKIDIWSTTKNSIFKDKFYPEDFSKLKYVWHRTGRTKLRSSIPDFPEIKSHIMFKTPDFVRNFGNLVDENWYLTGTDQEPCTGLLTILTSTLFYSDVTITGFTFYEEKNIDPSIDYSYYRKDQAKHGYHPEDEHWNLASKLGFTGVEVCNRKKEIINELSEKGLIKILKRGDKIR